ncbi:MAG: UPF0261 family protein, partial [Deltaproteobacteria bacterium]
MEKFIVLIGTLDTKAEELEFAKEQIEKRGHKVILLDISVGNKPAKRGDVSCEELWRLGGGGTDMWSIRDRKKRTKIMTDGAIKKVKELFDNGTLGGIMAIGGAGGTLMGTDIMKAVPFGVPKFMVSSNASARGFPERYFDIADITMMHTVVDVAGLSDPLRFLITQAAGAICGMVESTPDREMLFTRDKPAIAICELMI